MAQYSIHSMLVSLNIQDAPLRYSPPRGPAINFTVTYNERESQQLPIFSYSNLGPKWTFGWLSYITDDPNVQLPSTSVYVPGGGAEIYQYDAASLTFLPDPQSHAHLVRLTNPDRYEKHFPDGSMQVFDKSNQSPTYPRKLFMTQMIDPAGNIVHIDYDAYFRVQKITDAIGQETHLYYELVTDPLKITKVADPFGVRFAKFDYDANGRLSVITDTIGIQSVFTYDGSTDTITSLTTPYGATTFLRGVNGTNRWIEATDPEGGKERVEYRDHAPGISPTELSGVVPAGMAAANANLDVRNTFYWDKKAMLVASGDYTKAKITHWLLTPPPESSTSRIAASEKMPLENRAWYAYEGQSDLSHEGSNANPSQIARVLDDGTTQLYQYAHNNSFGKTTAITDPLGRRTTYLYDSNEIDLLETRQMTGTSNELVHEFPTYNSLHEPLTERDAARQLTIYTYNSYGQMLTRTNAKFETTTYAYGATVPDGYLASITSPPSNGVSAVIGFGYDSFKRIRTVTNNADDYTVTTDYDNLDRKIKVTYLDGTYEQFEYTQEFPLVGPKPILDLTGSVDRLGRRTLRRYNGNRQMYSITEPGDTQPRTTLYGWCTCGSLTSMTDPNMNLTTFVRDLQSRVTSKVFGDGTAKSTTINYTYENTTSRLKSMTDALNRQTKYSYFSDNNISQVDYTDPSGNSLSPPTPTVSYTYDPNYNRLATMTDGTGLTTYTYYQVNLIPTLGAGKLQSIDSPLANDTITYSYDELGRRLRQSINGVAEIAAYDSLGRLTTTDNDVLGHFGHDYDGVTPRLQTFNYPNGQTANYTYFGNTQDRRLKTLRNLAGSVNLSQFDYDYDPEGQIKSWIKLLDTTVSGLWFDYDNARQLRSARNALSLNTATKKLDYDYDGVGNRTSDRNYNPNQLPSHGIANSYGINVLNQVETRTRTDAAASPETQAFVYDAVGNLTSDGAGKTFEWDAANRLIAINYMSSGNRTAFAYDGLGRRVKITEYGPGVSAEVEPEGKNYATFAAGKFSLPAGLWTITLQGLNPNGGDNTMLVDSVTLNNILVINGSFESPSVTDYQVAPTDTAWSFSGTAGVAANQGTYTSDNPNTTAGTQVAFVRNYGSLSQSLSLSAGTYKLNFKAAQRGSGNESSQRLRVTFRSSASVITAKTFVWCGNKLCEERDGTGANVTKRFFAEGEQRIEGGTAVNYYYTRDHLGSIREVTDSTGALKARYDYDPYGNRVVLSGQLDIDFGYTGYYYHAPSGLNLTLYRPYNPALGRWLNRDPIGEDGGVNLYGYVENDPVNRDDPFGLYSSTPNMLDLGQFISRQGRLVSLWRLLGAAGAGAAIGTEIGYPLGQIDLGEDWAPNTKVCDVAEDSLTQGAIQWRIWLMAGMSWLASATNHRPYDLRTGPRADQQIPPPPPTVRVAPGRSSPTPNPIFLIPLPTPRR